MTNSKPIYVNIWDDYRQVPEHPYNETTNLRIEDRSLQEDDLLELREKVFRLCKDWEPLLSGIHFSRSWKTAEIDVIELDTAARKQLLEWLNKHQFDFRGRTVRFTSES